MFLLRFCIWWMQRGEGRSVLPSGLLNSPYSNSLKRCGTQRRAQLTWYTLFPSVFLYLPAGLTALFPKLTPLPHYPGSWVWCLESVVGIYIFVCINDVIHCLDPFHQKTKQGIFVFLEIKPSQKKTECHQAKVG